MAHKKVTQHLNSILESFSELEIDDFKSSFKKKNEQLKLFENYLLHQNIEDLEQQENLLKNNLLGDFTELNQNLYDRILSFLIFQKKEQNKTVQNLEDEIKLCYELLGRRITDVAIDRINKIYKQIKEIKPNRDNYHVFMQYLNLVLEAPSFTRELDSYKFNTSFYDGEVIEWLNNICTSAIFNATYRKSKKSENIELNPIYYFYWKYHFEKENIAKYRKIKQDQFPMFSNLKNASIQPNMEISNLINLHAEFEILKSTIKLNEPSSILEIIKELEFKLNGNSMLAYRSYIFTILELFNLRIETNIGVDNFKIIINKESKEIDYNSLLLFSKNDIDKFSLRLAINQGVIYLLAKDYEKAYEQFSSIPLNDNLNEEYKFIIKLYSVLSDPLLKQNQTSKTLDLIKRSKFEKSDFMISFIKFLSKELFERQLILKGKEFLQNHKPESIFEKIAFQWLMNICA
jgi:hypothetical protein